MSSLKVLPKSEIKTPMSQFCLKVTFYHVRIDKKSDRPWAVFALIGCFSHRHMIHITGPDIIYTWLSVCAIPQWASQIMLFTNLQIRDPRSLERALMWDHPNFVGERKFWPKLSGVNRAWGDFQVQFLKLKTITQTVHRCLVTNNMELVPFWFANINLNSSKDFRQ